MGIPLSVKAEIKHETSAFWSDSYHSEDGKSNGSSAYIANAQAQFFRFSSQASSMAKLPLTELNSLKPDLVSSAAVNLGGEFKFLSGQLDFMMRMPSAENFPAKMAIPYIVKDLNTRESQSKIYDAGSFYGEFTATVYGLAAASVSLSGGLDFGPSETDGGLGVKGKSFMEADYNQHPNASTSVRVQEGAKILTGVSAQATTKVDVFAGVETGGVVTAKCFWKPPVEGERFQELGSVEAQGSVNVGVGFSGEIRLAYDNGKLIFIVASKLVWGPGASGKVSITLNPLVADRFLDCLLAILKESGFSHIEVLGDIDENGENAAFTLLNQTITTALILGIGFGEALLLPAVTIAAFQKDALQEEYAPELASYLINNKGKSNRRDWVRNLPPEVLANLLNCLINKVDPPSGGWFGQDDAFDRRLAKWNKGEQDKANAIALIFTWIGSDEGRNPSDEEIEKLCQQFEKTLILMGGYSEQARAPAEKWRRFANSWQAIEDFIFVTTDLFPREDKIFLLEAINKVSKLLGKNMQGYRHTTHLNEVEYYAYRKPLESKDEIFKEPKGVQDERTLLIGKIEQDAKLKNHKVEKLQDWVLNDNR